MRNVLVISSSEWPVAALRAALGDDIDELRVVVPAVHQSRLQWLTNADDDARERADDAASSIGDALPSQGTEASAGDPDPVLAVKDALGESRRTRSSWSPVPTRKRLGWKRATPTRLLRALGGIKVTRLVVSDDS